MPRNEVVLRPGATIDDLTPEEEAYVRRVLKKMNTTLQRIEASIARLEQRVATAEAKRGCAK